VGKVIDITGQKFGRLTVIERSYPNDKNRSTRWLCKCECGTEKIILRDSLKSGKTKSCGCLNKERLKYANEERKLPLGLAKMRQLINDYKRHAKRRDLEWNLTEEQFKEITQKDCHYCGTKPDNIMKNYVNNNYNGEYIYNGIDRVYNNKGYTIDNVVPCCKKCNIAKNNSTLQEFRDWIKRTYIRLWK